MTASHVQPGPTHRDRRRRSRWAALVAVFVVAIAALASLGAPASGAQAKSDPNGVLKVASSLSPLGPLHFDPATSNVNADLAWESMIFGTLMRWDDKGQLQPWMAESVKVVDPQTVQMTLRDGMTFTDGTPYDAQAVATGLMHIKNDASAASAASRSAGFKFLDSVTVDSPTQVTMKLNAPGTTDFLESLAHREGAIVSPKQIGTGDIDTKPIGAGPFKFDSYTPDQILSVRKNKDFFDKDHFEFGGIDYVNAVGPAAVNGLLAGTLDVAGLQTTDIDSVKANGGFDIVSGTTDSSYISLQVCPNKAPFDNEQFRKGVQLAFDRDAIVALAFQGHAQPAYGLWPEGNVNFNPATKKINTFNQKKAKQLIKASGVDPTFDLHYVTATNYGPLAEVVQSQLKDVGVTANIVPDVDILNSFISPQKAGGQMVPNVRRNIDKYSRLYQPGNLAALCGVYRQDIMDTIAPTASQNPKDPARAAEFKKAELMAAQNANPYPLVFTTTNVALAKDKVGGKLFLSPVEGAAMWDDITVNKG